MNALAKRSRRELQWTRSTPTTPRSIAPRGGDAEALRLPPGDADVTTSGGEKRRVALCNLPVETRHAAAEPTNYLDAESVAWLEHFLHDYPGTAVAVTHDRYSDNVAGGSSNWTAAGHSLEGNYSSWPETERPGWNRKRARTSPPGRCWRRSLNGSALAPRLRQAKEGPYHAHEEMASKSRTRKDHQRDRHPARRALATWRSRAVNLKKGWSATACCMTDLTFNLPSGGIVGVIGPNGAGKTTLFRLLYRPGKAGWR